MPDSLTRHCYLSVHLACRWQISLLTTFHKLSVAQMNGSDSRVKSLIRAGNLPRAPITPGTDFVAFQPQGQSNDQVAVRSHGVEIEPRDTRQHRGGLEAVAPAIGVDPHERVGAGRKQLHEL